MSYGDQALTSARGLAESLGIPRSHSSGASPRPGVRRVEERRLDVGSVKRNARTEQVSQPHRREPPLDLPSRDGESARAVARLRSGLVKLPKRPIPVRDLAALMGHNPATHHRHDGK
jgi:hypothetical protein